MDLFKNPFTYTKLLEWVHYLLICRNIFCHCSANTNVFIIHLILDQALGCVMLSSLFHCLFALMNTHEPESECRPVVLLMLGRKDFKRTCLSFFPQDVKLLTGGYLNGNIISSPIFQLFMCKDIGSLKTLPNEPFLTLLYIVVVT